MAERRKKGFFPTISEVAKEAGVSRTTVSRYINNSGYVSKDAREKIEKAIRAVGYRPNKIAQSLTKHSTGNIALVLSDIANPISAIYAKGVESVAREHDLNLIICNTGFDLQTEIQSVNRLIEKQIDGIIIAPCGKGKEHIEEVIQRGIPLVFISRRIHGVNADYVRFANEQGSFQVVEHLIKLGHRRIGIISRDLDRANDIERLKGYKEALHYYGIPVDESLIQSGQAVEEVGYEKMKILLALPNPPTAVYTAVNLFAVGVLKLCRERGIRIPEDLAVASFESFSYLDPIISPPLTANRMPVFELGVTAAQLLVERIKAKDQKSIPYRDISLQGELVVRESTVGKKAMAALA